MSIHCVYISSASKDGNAVDAELRRRFHDVYRVGTDFWLVDTGHAADHVADAMQHILTGSDKMFVAAMTRDFVPVLSAAAKGWLVAPERSWREHRSGSGTGEAAGSLFAIAA